jgi:hypothetical protein
MRTAIKNRWMIFMALLVLHPVFYSSSSLAQSSPGYSHKTYVISSGGNNTTSMNYRLLSTAGQFSAIGISFSGNYVNHAGFWHTLILSRMIYLPLILKE